MNDNMPDLTNDEFRVVLLRDMGYDEQQIEDISTFCNGGPKSEWLTSYLPSSSPSSELSPSTEPHVQVHLETPACTLTMADIQHLLPKPKEPKAKAAHPSRRSALSTEAHFDRSPNSLRSIKDRLHQTKIFEEEQHHD